MTAWLLGALCACAAWADAAPSRRPVAAFLDDGSRATQQAAAAGIGALGGRVLHAFGDVLIVELPAGKELAAYRVPGIREVALNAVPAGPRSGGTAASFGRAAWNAIASAPDRAAVADADPEPLDDDALTPPSVSLEAVRSVSKAFAATASVAPYGATALNTSEFLAGSVSINIVLVESDGSIDPSTENWSASRENEVVAAIAQGLEWIRVQEPQSALRFVYHVYAGRTDARARTGLEPIHRAADPTGLTGEDRWVKDVLGKLGYVSGDRFARSRAFDADTRSADGTDWAVTVYVVDSLVDADGKFADGRFAYTWIGGPHVVMTYDNQAWGISRMNMVLRHELLHAFYAFDEYAGSACICNDHRGYLDGPNTNCEACNPAADACVMISNGDALCQATRRQVGWADLDGDGVIDVVGQDPATFLDAMPAQVCAPPTLSGLSTVVAATNRNTYPGTTHPSISINHVTGIEVRVDGEAWSPSQSFSAEPAAPQQRFNTAVSALEPGSHHFEVRTVDDFGNRDAEPGTADVLVAPSLSALGDSVRAARSGTDGLSLSWSACAGATRYRVYRRVSPQAQASVIAETTSNAWSTAGASTGYYQVVPVDACGGERAD